MLMKIITVALLLGLVAEAFEDNSGGALIIPLTIAFVLLLGSFIVDE